MSRLRPRLFLLALATLAVAWACTDDRLTGPLARRVASLILPKGAFKTPYVLAGASARIDTVRVILKNPDSTLVIDTSIFVPVGADSLKFSYDLIVTGSPLFGATLQYKSQGVVLFQSSGTVTASTANSPPGAGVLDVPPLLIGPGSNAKAVSILPRDTVVSFGGSVTYRTSATDAGGAPITPFLSVLTTSDPSVPIGANGLVAAPALRRVIWVKVLIPLATPVVDSTRVTFAPVPVTLRVQAGNAQAGTVGLALTQPIIARVLAADSIGVAGVPVTFTTTTPGAVISTPTVVTDSAGDAITIVTLGPIAGAQAFSATSSVGTRGFTATANAAAPNAMTVVSGNARTVVAGTPVDSVPTVRVTDQFGNPVPGATVVFAVTGGGGSVSGGNAITNGAGQASPTSWTLGLTAGANTLRATVGAVAPITFSATGVAGPPATITKVRGDLIARVAGAAVDSTPRLRVTDLGGNPVAGAAVNFSTLTGGGSVTGTTPITDPQGFANLGSWTLGTVAGANTIRATVGALPAATFTITGTSGAAAILAKNGGDARTATVGTPTDTAPGALVTDINSNPVAGVTVTFAVTGGGGAITGGTVVTNAQGLARAGAWTLGAVPGANTASASSAGLTPLTFTATGMVGAAASVTKVRGDLITRTAGAAVDSTPRLRVLDALGNAVSGVTVNFSGVTGGGSVTGTAPVTDPQGFAALGTWTLGTTAGANTVQATVGALPAVTFTITGAAGPAANMVKAGGDLRVAAAGTPTDTAPGVLVTDVNANPVSGVTVTFAVTSGGGSITGGTQVTDPQGRARAGSWTLGPTPGANTASASAPGVSTLTFSATGTAGAPSVLAINAGQGQSATVGTAVAIAPQVKLADALGNPIPGAAVTFTVTSGGGSVTGGSTTTDGAGLATVGSWTLGLASGANTLQASSPGVASATFNATGLPGAAASLAILSGNNQTATAGSAIAAPLIAVVRDANSNPVPGVAVTFTIATGGGSLTGGTTTTDALGRATLGSWTLGTTAGSNTITIASAGLPNATATASGVPGAAASLVIVAGNGQTAAVSAAVPIAPSVRLVDANGNGISGATVTFSVTAGGGSITGGTATTDGTGLATVGSWTLGTSAGANTLQAASTGVASVTFTASASAGGPASITVVSGNGQSSIVNSALATPLVVVVRDANSNPVAGANVTFAITAGGGSLTGASQVTDASGQATLGSWTLGVVAGVNSLTATVPPLAPVTFTATGLAGGPAVIQFVSDSVPVGTVGAAVTPQSTVAVRDLFGNPVNAANVNFAVITGGGSVAPATVNTNAAGLASTTWTLGSTAGAQSMRASVSGVGTPKTFLATALPAAASTIVKIAGDAQSGPVGSPFSTPPTVRVNDSFGNAVPGATVTFAAVGGTSVVVGGVVQTNGLGLAAPTSWTPSVQGSVSLTASTPGATTVTFTGTGTAAGVPRLIVESGGVQFVRAGGSRLTTPIVVRAIDGGGNPIAGAPVTVSATMSGSGPIVGFGGAVNTAADGRITILNVPIGTQPGLIVVNFGPVGGTIQGLGVPITIVGSPALMISVGGDKQVGRAGDTLTVPLSVFIVDSKSQPVPFVPVSFALSATNTGGLVPQLNGTVYTITTDSIGFASLRVPLPTSAGTLRVTASSAGLPSVTFTSDVTPIAGSGTPVKVEILNGALRASAGQFLADTIFARHRTANGNVLANRYLWFQITTSEGALTRLDSVLTDAQGLARIAPFLVGDSSGTATIEVTDRLVNLGCGFLTATANISVSGPAVQLELVSGANQVGPVGTTMPQPVVVRVLDAGGRPVIGKSVSWVSTFPSASGGGSITGNFGAATTDQSGLATIAFRVGANPGDNRMTISVAGAPQVIVIATGQ